MSRLRVNALGISIDGFSAGPEQSLENPMRLWRDGAAPMGLRNQDLPEVARRLRWTADR